MSRLGDTGLNVEENGIGDPVILIHGVTLDLNMWLPQVPVLSTYFRVIRYDLRGFGRSERVMEPEHHDKDDLKLLLDTFEIEKAHLVGLSRGGRVALEFAVENPSRVRKLVLIAPALRYKNKSDDKPFPQDDYRRQTIEYMEKAANSWLQAPIWKSPGLDDIRPEIKRIVLEFFAWKHIVPNSDLDYFRILTLGVPILLLIGDGESPEMTKAAEDLRDKITKCQYQIVPKAGHIANLDNPDVVNDALLKFLKDSNDDSSRP